MRSFFKNTLLFCLLTLIFSTLSGCGSSEVSNNADKGANGDSPSATGSPDNKYPLLKDDIVDVDLELVKGGTTRIKDHRGKVVLLNLWATWCGPCRQEMPHLIELQNRYRDQGFEILGLNVGYQESDEPEPIEDIQAFAKKMQLNYELARIPPDVTKNLQKIAQMQAVPESFLIDREGRLQGVFVGGGPDIVNKLKSRVGLLINQ